MSAGQGSLSGHDIDNYTIGKGIVSLKLLGETHYTDMGNVSLFEFLPKPTLLPHWSSRTGIATKDQVVATKLEGMLTIHLDEFSARNMALALMGNVSDSADINVDILQQGIVNGAIQFQATNLVGPQWTWLFPSVNFSPNKAIGLISDTWAEMEIQGDVLATNGHFGTATAVLRDSPSGII